MQVTNEAIAREHTFLTERADRFVELINHTRSDLGRVFDLDVDPVDRGMFSQAVDDVFERSKLAVNVAGFMMLLRHLDVTGDYPGFIVDERIGRDLAATIAGGEPEMTLAEATFHVVDMSHHPTETNAGMDDLEAGVTAGFQTRLPGWEWRDSAHPFDE